MNRQRPYPRICLRGLAVSALLAVFIACGDGPTELAAPVEAPTTVTPEVTVPENALTTVLQLFDDPFVRELMNGIGADATALRSAARAASTSRTTAHVLTLSSVLMQTRSGLLIRADDAGDDPDDEILRSALELVLDDAVSLLEQLPPSIEEEQEQRDEQSEQDTENTETQEH